MTIANLDTIWVTANVPEKDTAFVSEEQPVTVTFPAYPETVFDGTGAVRQRRARARHAAHQGSHRVPKSRRQLKPGMFANATFVAPMDLALVVPTSALLMSNDRTSVFVEVAAMGVRAPRRGDRIPGGRDRRHQDRPAGGRPRHREGRGASSMIDQFVAFCFHKRVLVVMIAAFFSVYGVYAWTQLPVDAYPLFSDVYVQVTTAAPGLAAEEVEQQITVPLERALNGVPGLARMRSSSTFGLSMITMRFRDGVGGLLGAPAGQRAHRRRHIAAGRLHLARSR